MVIAVSNGTGSSSVTSRSVVIPDSPLASTPSQNAASSRRVVSATGASEPPTSWLAVGRHVPPTAAESCRSCARSPRPLSMPHAKHEREIGTRSEEHTSELQSQFHLVCRLLLEKKKK